MNCNFFWVKQPTACDKSVETQPSICRTRPRFPFVLEQQNMLIEHKKENNTLAARSAKRVIHRTKARTGQRQVDAAGYAFAFIMPLDREQAHVICIFSSHAVNKLHAAQPLVPVWCYFMDDRHLHARIPRNVPIVRPLCGILSSAPGAVGFSYLIPHATRSLAAFTSA